MELIIKLIELGKVRVFFTQDGKEYVTAEQLELEIKDEIFQAGGISFLATCLFIFDQIQF